MVDFSARAFGWAAVAALLVFAAGCGGGGSGGASTSTPPRPPAAPPAGQTPPPAVGFENGTFAASSSFANRCALPRTGTDPSGRAWPDVQGTTTDENNFLRSWSNELYLWFDEIVDVDPESLSTPEYFDAMKSLETTPSGAPKDKFHFTRDTDEFLAFAQSGVEAGYGMDLAVLQSRVPREIRIVLVQPGSPAALAGLERGDTIVETDGVDVVNAPTQEEVDVINDALFRVALGDTHEIGVVPRGGGDVVRVSLTGTEITTVPVQTVKTIDTPSGPVGYFAFNAHIEPAEDGLFEAIEQLSAEGVVDLVVDLRYNGGGLLAIAGQLAYMIAGPAAAQGRVFEELEFNSKHPVFNPVTGQRIEPDLFPTTTLGFSRGAGEALPSVDLERVFMLTGPGTCSASESIFNALRGIGVEVVQIGNNTCGKPYGFYPQDNCGTTYFSIQFRGVNAQGWGDYADGFAPGIEAGPAGVVPGCVVADDFDHVLGDPAEARLAAALTFRDTGACPVAAAASGAESPGGGIRIEKDSVPVVEPPAWRQGAWRSP